MATTTVFVVYFTFNILFIKYNVHVFIYLFFVAFFFVFATYFYTDRSKAVLLLWFLTVLAVCVYTLVHLLR